MNFRHMELKSRLFELTEERNEFREENKLLQEQLEEVRAEAFHLKAIADVRADRIHELVQENRNLNNNKDIEKFAEDITKAFSNAGIDL